MSKFTEGQPFESAHEMLHHIMAGGWIKAYGRPVHPSWAISWQISALKGFRHMRPLFRKEGPANADKAPWEAAR